MKAKQILNKLDRHTIEVMVYTELRQDAINEVKNCNHTKMKNNYQEEYREHCDKCKYLIDHWDILESELK